MRNARAVLKPGVRTTGRQELMEFDARIELFHRRIRARNGSLSFLDPLPFRLLRRVGVRLPPPVFQPMWFNMLLVFLVLDIPLTGLVLAWPVVFDGSSLVYLMLFSFISTLASAALALALGLAWWHQRNRLRLPRWRDYDSD